MGTMPSPSQLQDVGSSSGGPPPISSSAIKRNKRVKSATAETQQKSLRNSPLKRPIETSTNKQPAAKRVKPSAAGNQEKTSRSSPLKRPIETSTKKQPAGKRFKPPMAEKMLSGNRSPLVRRSPLARTPQLRLVVSPVIMAHSPRNSPSPPPLAVERSPSPSTSAPPYLDEETSLPGNCCLCAHFVNVIVYRLFRVLICLMSTNVISGSKYPTSNLYFHEMWSVKEVLEKESSSQNPVIVSMVTEMKAKFEKYWNISYLSNCIPVILDPRFKFGFVEFRLNKTYGETARVHIDKVDKAIRSLYSGYSSEMGESFNNSAQGGESASSEQVHSWSDWSQHMSYQSNQVTGELDRYLRDELFPCDGDRFDILYWWQMHVPKYPILSRMARDVFAVTASTVAAESAFSTSGRIVTDYRNRLSGNTIEALICFQNWLREAGASYLDIIKIDSLSDIIEEAGSA